MFESTRPRKDAGNGVGARRVALLVLAIVTCHGSVGGLGLDCLAVRTHEHARHQAEGAVTCGWTQGSIH